MATVLTVDFSRVQDIRMHPSGNPQDGLPKRSFPMSAEGKSLSPKQIRARARRKSKRNQVMTDQEMDYLYNKPVEDWDLEELARGRPRDSRGGFRGPKPKWINAEVHERAMEKYTAAVKTDMRATTVDALGLLRELIRNDDIDDKGKPIVPASTKLDAAKFLLEHVVGKPTQRIESDVSVKLQGILGSVMVNPTELVNGQQGYELGHFPGLTMELAESRGDDPDNYYGDLNG